MNRSITLLLLVIQLVLCRALAQSAAIQRIDPTNWWVGLKNPNLQLLVYGPKAGSMTYTINYPGVKLVKTQKAENPDFIFLDLLISATAKPGTFRIVGKSGSETVSRAYELKPRTTGPKGQGVSAADFIYLIMPDRFANGDPANDAFPDLLDTKADRSVPHLRHGGDLQGITNHLDYLQELGVTALWMTPVLANDETLKQEAPDRMQAGYHGYHFTDHYQIDKRFGGTEGYRKLGQALHQRGMKLVQDAVYNHVSDDHWLYKNQPFKDWFNQWPTYTGSSHKEQALYDPYSSASDRKVLLDGWFTPFLPDLNLRNSFLSTYLIQHAIWCTELFALDAWRVDTYKYNDLNFLNRCNQALLTEYPKLHIFGEAWVGNPVAQAFFVKNRIEQPFKSNQPGGLDFVLYDAFNAALKENFGWDSGVNRVYQALATDAVYADPQKLVTFLDNHDTDRYLSVIGDDYAKYKMGVTWLLTTRGIPSWYYGTEVLMKNTKNPSDAEVRRDFPGGFPGDPANKFTDAGRNEKEKDAFNFVKKLANYRKNTPTLHAGKLMQFIPQNGTYVYFRYDASKTVMIATNSTEQEINLETGRFAERMAGFTKARNVLTDEVINSLTTLKLPAKTAVVLELAR
ncbi:glycoside hydrolase family 13 protein [Larkinella punicea]|uniref:Alpha-amylase n=1 Tax=Larkinella punicea TaxID=2315727 RepID=A0A368JF66_9BACT|nr:glycoside hydrolase family 13 protein [Larkinella punicea]RCR66300.1 alpha-amylase [Larkinella punicea]